MAFNQNKISIDGLMERGLPLGIILAAALCGFEMFNFSTTEVALKDVLGTIEFLSIPWATILAIAFCGIDFAGIARLFIPQDDQSSPNETWYLMGAWLLAASMNAILTWWGVSLGLVNRSLASTAFIAPDTLVNIVPVFVALMVWLTRILLIGSFSVAGNRMFQSPRPALSRPVTPQRPAVQSPVSRSEVFNPHPAAAFSPRPQNTVAQNRERSQPRPSHRPRPEPEYIPEGSYAAASTFTTGSTNGDPPRTQNFL